MTSPLRRPERRPVLIRQALFSRVSLSLSRVISDGLMSHTHQVFGVFMTPTCRSLLTPLNLSRQTDLINIMIKAQKESLALR